MLQRFLPLPLEVLICILNLFFQVIGKTLFFLIACTCEEKSLVKAYVYISAIHPKYQSEMETILWFIVTHVVSYSCIYYHFKFLVINM